MKKIKFLFILLCISLLMLPMAVHAEDNGDKKSKYFSVDLLVETHTGLGPGDYFSEEFTITSTSEETIKVRMYDIQNIGDTFLYSAIKAGWASSDSETVYGAFDELQKTTDWISLEPGETHVMRLNMYFPAECKNIYQGTEMTVRFFYECNGDIEINVPQTGDNSNVFQWILVGGASLLILLILIFTRKKNESDDKLEDE